MATYSSILAQRIHRGAWQATVHGVAESDTSEVTEHASWTLRGNRPALPFSAGQSLAATQGDL